MSWVKPLNLTAIMHAIMLWLQRTRLELAAPIAFWTLVEGLPLPHLEVRLEPRAQVHASRVGSSPVAVLRYLDRICRTGSAIAE